MKELTEQIDLTFGASIFKVITKEIASKVQISLSPNKLVRYESAREGLNE